MVLAVNASDLGGQRLDAVDFLAHKDVMGTGDVGDQVGKRLIFRIFSPWRGGRAGSSPAAAKASSTEMLASAQASPSVRFPPQQ